MALPSLDQVIFPEQSNTNFSRILGDLKRSNLSITNRLRSIKQDAAFVQAVGQTLELPLVANERCGSWYIDPRLKTASAYFKSTDGHTGQWKFSTRRLNLHLLELIANHNGCVMDRAHAVVDQTADRTQLRYHRLNPKRETCVAAPFHIPASKHC